MNLSKRDGLGRRSGSVIIADDGISGDHPFHFIARLYLPGMPPALMREAIARYAEQVIPAVARRTTRSPDGRRQDDRQGA
jgi:hypothetical protein